MVIQAKPQLRDPKASHRWRTYGQTPFSAHAVSPTNAISLGRGIVGSSSRGPSISSQGIKPEIGAPGGSLSAQAGTGSGQSPFSGTSGAAPMVAGAAALMIQAHPERTPLELKAMLMNSAETEIYTNRSTLPGQLAPSRASAPANFGSTGRQPSPGRRGTSRPRRRRWPSARWKSASRRS
jgi:subtilisin family serine protease